MRLSAYRDVTAIAGARSVLLIGFLVRLPMFATGIVLMLHVVSTLGRTYGEAGLVSAAFTIALAISAPWRGRLLDRYGLRRVVAPSIVVTALVWTAMPFLEYAVLLPVSVLGGLFVVPSFSILRQGLIAVVPDDRRRTALSLDSVFTELSFMIGPAVAVWAAATYDTRWVLVVLAVLNLIAALVIYAVNPPLRSEQAASAGSTAAAASGGSAEPVEPGEPAAGGPRASWVSLSVVAVLVAAAASTIVLAGSDVSIVAALRSTGDAASIGWVLSVWGAGSLIGGLLYGAWHRSISVFWLLGGLALSTLPVALAGSLPWLVVLLFICGVLCAPTITATVDHLSRVVPEEYRGEAMGWHGSAMTAGQAIGAPLAGFAIDRAGWGWGFISVSLAGLVVAVVGAAAERVARTRRAAASASARELVL
ncbi:MAG: MFS transporter [Candidatus Phosphoribacter sp.]